MGDFNDPGLLSPPETALLTDQYELTMAASYLRRDMNEPAVFELFVRELPVNRDWLLCAGLGPTLSLVERLAFGERDLAGLAELGFDEELLDYLSRFRFSGDIDAMPEGTVAFANEPMLRVTARRIEAQLLETLLLNQLNFQTALATKSARLVLAAGDGDPGAGGTVVDFSPRRDHGVDAAMKAARSAAIAGAAGTSNVAAAVRYGLAAVGTMAHSYVMSFPTEQEAFRAFLEDTPQNTTLLVDTYETEEGVRNAVAASRSTRTPLAAIRIDSGDLLELSRRARRILDDAGMSATKVLASGDLNEARIHELVRAGAPIDSWGVGTELGTSRDSPALSGVYKLVADRPGGSREWRPVVKRSPEKGTMPYPKQVFRQGTDGRFSGDLVAMADERIEGEPLLVPAMRGGEIVHRESLERVRERAHDQLRSLPPDLRLRERDSQPRPYPVTYSRRLRELEAAAGAGAATGRPLAPA